MGYRPDDQALQEPIDKILNSLEEGEKAFTSAVMARVTSNEWRQEALDKWIDIAKRIQALKFDLLKIRQETW